MTDSIQTLVDDFEFLDDWEDRYGYVIELGKALDPLPAEYKTDATKVRGCVSQVWMISETDSATPPHFTFRGESDAMIVQGLIAILLRMYNGKTAQEIIDIDAQSVFKSLGLDEHLSPQRSNGLASMVKRIQRDAGNDRSAADQAS